MILILFSRFDCFVPVPKPSTITPARSLQGHFRSNPTVECRPSTPFADVGYCDAHENGWYRVQRHRARSAGAFRGLSIKRGYLHRRVVEACPFGEIGPEICGDQCRDCLPGAARRQPCALLAGHDSRWHVIRHLERQDDFAAVVPHPYLDAVPQASLRSVLGVHQKRRRLVRTNEAAEG